MLLDFLWINFISKKFYFKEFKNHINIKKGKIKVKKTAAALVYVILSLGIFFFASYQGFLIGSMIRGFVLGFLIYSVYDLTNYAVMKDYSLKFALIDIAWGTILSTIVSGMVSLV